MSKKKLDQNLKALVKALDEERISSDTLTPRLRRRIVLFLMRSNSTMMNAHISHIVGVSEAQVVRIKRSCLRSTDWDVDAEMRDLVSLSWMKSNECQRRAIAAGNPVGAWGIFLDCVKLMQSLGYVFEAPKKIALAQFNASDFKGELRRLFDEFGVPSLPEFAERLRQISDGNGNAGRVIETGLADSKPGDEGGGDRQPAGQGPQN